MNFILAIDPGKRNGFAFIELDGNRIGVRHMGVLTKVELTGVPLCTWLSRLGYRMIDEVVCEDWITTSRMNATEHREVLTIIGNLEQMCMREYNVPLIMRKPQQREIARKAFGFCKKAHDNDAFSAMLHGISYLMGSTVSKDLKVELSDSVQNFFKENKLYPLDKRISIRYNDFVEGQ